MRIDNATNLSELFKRRIDDSPRKVAYCQFDGSQWQEVTWEQVRQGVARWQAAFKAEKLEKGDRVGICLPNRLEWVLFDQAALGLGLVSVPLFYNDRPENMAWCLKHAEAKMLFLGNGAQWNEMREQSPTLNRVVCLEKTPDDDRAISLEDWLPDTGDDATIFDGNPDDLATLVYTSGTTGMPKGVMLTHRNIASDVSDLLQACPEIDGDDHFLSFLPMSHMFERTVGYYVSMAVGAKTSFARSILDLAEDMISQQPTIMVCVPRIFERVYTKVQEGLGGSALKKFLFKSAYKLGYNRFRGKRGGLAGIFWPILDTLVGKKVRSRFGGHLRYVLLGGAPMPEHLLEIFTGLGLTFLHGYGLTETSPVLCFNRVHDNEPMSVGKPLRSTEIKLGEGDELLVRGPMVMPGYWQNQEATDNAIDKDGWFHTGDVVRLEGNRIFITGRMKEIIVMLNGEKVPPGDVEQALLNEPAFEQVMLIGEARAKLGLIVVTQLTDAKEIWRRANDQLHAFPGYCKICHVLPLKEAWTVENDMLTPKLSMKRHRVEEKFKKEIESMFDTDLCRAD